MIINNSNVKEFDLSSLGYTTLLALDYIGNKYVFSSFPSTWNDRSYVRFNSRSLVSGPTGMTYEYLATR